MEQITHRCKAATAGTAAAVAAVAGTGLIAVAPATAVLPPPNVQLTSAPIDVFDALQQNTADAFSQIFSGVDADGNVITGFFEDLVNLDVGEALFDLHSVVANVFEIPANLVVGGADGLTGWVTGFSTEYLSHAFYFLGDHGAEIWGDWFQTVATEFTALIGFETGSLGELLSLNLPAAVSLALQGLETAALEIPATLLLGPVDAAFDLIGL